MRTVVIVFLLLTALSAPALSASRETGYERMMHSGTLRCGYSVWPPFFEVDVNTGQLKGLVKEVSDDIGNILHVKMEYVPIAVGDAPQALASGKIDAACGDGPWILAAIKNLNYTESYLYAGVRLYGRADDKRIVNDITLNNPSITFVGLDGDLTTDLVQRLYPKANLRTLPGTADPPQMFMDIATHKADYIITDPLSVSLFMKNNPGKIRQMADKTAAFYGAGFSVAKDDIQLLLTLNEATKAAIDTGLIDKVIMTYDPKGMFLLPAAKPYEVKR